MILDALLEMSDAQAVTATAISTNVIDLGPVTDNVLRDIGTGEEVYLVLSIPTTFTAGGAATLTAALVSDSTVNLATSPTTHVTVLNAAAVATLTAGSLYAVKLPAGNYERYLGIQYTVATGPMTAGAIDAFLSKDVQMYRAYADRTPIDGQA